MEIVFEKVFERDIDLMIIERFINDSKFKNIFLKKAKLDKTYQLIAIEHSLTDENGESDITVTLKDDFETIGLLIENKIDAVAMPNQRNRYDLRGEKGVKNKKFSRFFVFMIAPREYLNLNKEAKKYENQISYEDLINYFEGNEFVVQLLSRAIEKKKNNYEVIENKNVTEFWQKYYKYIRENYPALKINEIEGPRGTRAVWPEIKTPIAKINIMHKSDRGFLDLTFPKMGEYMNIFNKYINNFLSDGMLVEKTNKSAVIRIMVPKIDFKMSFDDYSQEIEEIMEKALCLRNLVLDIDLKNMYEEIQIN